MEDLNRLTTIELQTLLRERGLSYRYNKKTDLIARLEKALRETNSGESEGHSRKDSKVNEGSESSHDIFFPVTPVGSVSRGRSTLENSEANQCVDIEEVCEGKKGNEIGIGNRNNLRVGSNNTLITMNEDSKPGPSGSSFVFRDVEEALETFNGESSRTVSTWLKTFEDIAVVCGWSDVQRYLYARRLLRGAARLSVESSTGIYSWKDLKTHLETEFSEKVTSISIHRSLEKRKKHPGESYLEYLYAMRQIACKGEVDEESLIIYIVSGIPDDVTNKAALYEARSLDELRQKLKVYQIMKGQRIAKLSKPSFERERGKESRDRCGNCGARSHPSSNCPHRAKGARCFNCGEFGHMSPNCPKPKAGKAPTNVSNVNSITSPDMHLDVLIYGSRYTGLLDTGSDVSLIRKSVYANVPASEGITGGSLPLLGFGRHLQMTLGSCVLTLGICNQDFEAKCHIIPDEWISTDILIGRDLLRGAKLIIESGKVAISKLCNSEASEEASNVVAT